MIPMPQNFPQIECQVPHVVDFEQVFAARAFAPFCDEVTAFLQGLSVWLMQDTEAKGYPDVVSFAFWCRKSALLKLKAEGASPHLRLGRGVVFHVAPANVPVNFAYSLVAGLLAGNANIVRIPTREFPQVDIICRALRELLAQAAFSPLANHAVLIRYEKDDAVTAFLSAHCDVRIIWGGDQAIAEIRRAPLPPRSFDLTFADRYSLCVVDADEYVREGNSVRIAQDFYNDTYLFDQNACTAPHLLVWLGTAKNIAVAKQVFWTSLHAVVSVKYQLQPISAIDKLSDAYHFAVLSDSCRLHKMDDNLIVRIAVQRLDQGLEEMRSTCGYFYEYDAQGLEDLLPLINRKVQTLSYYGIGRGVLQKFIEKNRPFGIDRIVPIGRTLDFSLVWDGYDLIVMLTRIVSLSS